MLSDNACYKVKGVTARTRTGSKTRTPQGRVVCSRAATHQASKATSKVATINLAVNEVGMDSKTQEVATARQAKGPMPAMVSRVKVVVLRTEAQGSTAMQ